jgi:hypothetical protein
MRGTHRSFRPYKVPLRAAGARDGDRAKKTKGR